MSIAGGRARSRQPASGADARSRARQGAPRTYVLADEDSVEDLRVHGQRRRDRCRRDSGSVAKRIASCSSDAGSSRTTWLWVAPELRFLPVRIEQRRDGEVQTAFKLVSVSDLTAEP